MSTETQGSTKVAPFAYPRLCIAYFFQLAIWGSWAGALGGYAGRVLELPGTQIGWLYAAIPIGAVISPMLIGPIADRYFAAQKVISVLHFLGGLCLLACGYLCVQGPSAFPFLETQIPGLEIPIFPFPILMTLIMLSGLFYMPTLALLNSVVFKHSPEGKAPYVFIFGTAGWIVVNLFIAAFLDGANNPYFFLTGGACGVFLAIYALTLPDTPPKGAPAPGEKADLLGLGALKLFKDPGFAIFAFCAFLASIPACNFFFTFQETYLFQHGYPSPLALTTLNQFSELLFMYLLPLAIGYIGLKWVVVLGIGAWALRYYIFSIWSFDMAILGLALHGFGYAFLYVASYMYADKKAPAELKASVQCLMAFLLLGVGQVLGSLLYGVLRDLPENAPPVQTMLAAKKMAAEQGLPAWNDIKMADSAWKYLDLGATVQGLMKKSNETAEAAAPVSDLGSLLDRDKDNTITLAELAAAPETLNIGGKSYAKADLEAVLKEMSGTVLAKSNPPQQNDYGFSRTAYLQAQAHNWKGILLGPAAFIAVFFVLFLLFGKNPEAKNTSEHDA